MCTRRTAFVAGCFQTSDSHSFFKAGRKIRVGDCALFEPPQDSPPFIGIIRCLIAEEEATSKFTVNWLYRASEVELERGIQLEAAPNEIFYSFHEDEVPAASLLHPCKVAFLPKGVEHPSGISSFICRRVYDINQKCLWWLTDQNYIDKRQKEVNHLLSKTRRDMHVTTQSGVRSPKTIDDAAPASQAKAGSDRTQNGSSFSLHGKGKKRERSDLNPEPVKRLQKVGVMESHQSKQENILKDEIARITDRGGLVNYESVEKLVQLMSPDEADKKIDLTGRLMLAGVVAATDKFDCLGWFVQLKGLPVFDLWLQEVRKGKIGDVTTHRDDETSVEEFLLVLLRALDKLPVNLHALQMCNIGKSVNHLRSHKCSEIQKKARSLVDTWKKRVEAEMNIDDGKPGSNANVAWHGRRNAESSQEGHKKSGSYENAVKSSSSSQYSAPRTVPPKPAQVDPAQTSASASPGYSKSALSVAGGSVKSKNALSKAVAVIESSDHLLMTVNDEKSSSSSHSHSQSCSSDPINTVDSAGKKDPRNSTAVSMGAGKRLRRTSRPRKSDSGLLVTASHEAHIDRGSNRDPLLSKPFLSEKISLTGSVIEKMHYVPAADGNSSKLIVKIPNRGRSHALRFNDGLMNEKCLSKSRAVSSECTNKHEKPDCGSKVKVGAIQSNDVSDVTTKSWHSSDLKDVLTGSDEADGSSAVHHDEVRSANGDHTRKIDESPKDASFSAAHGTKPWRTHELSFSPMNALIESCVKHSEANALISAVDDVGMNLLASVAASEMSKCDSVATNSPGNTTVAEDSGNTGRSSNMESNTQEQTHHTVKIKLDDENYYEESTSLVTNGQEVKLSTDEKLVTDLSDADLLKKQDEGELCDTREISSSEVSMELAPDNLVDNQNKINKAESEEVPRGTSVHSSGANHGFNRVGEVVSGAMQIKESPSTMHSDAIGPNNATRSPSGAERLLNSEKAVSVLSQKKIEHDGSSRGGMDQIPPESESHDDKCMTTEIHKMAVRMSSDNADNNRSYKEMRQQNKEILLHLNGDKESVIKMVESPSIDARSASPTAGMEKLKFDLNEGFTADEVKYEEQKSIAGASCPVAMHVISPFPYSVSVVSNGLPASVTVAAAVKRAFVPPEDLLQTRGGELGWKGSAATSAFRPAEPRKISENTSSLHSDAVSQSTRPFLNIDLNVADDSFNEDMVSQSGTNGILPRNKNGTPVCGYGVLDLDLNQVGDINEMVQSSTVTTGKLEVPGLQSKPGKLHNVESCCQIDFDLNNGPCIEEAGAEASTVGQNVLSNMPSHPPAVGIQINNAEMGNFVSWFPQGNAIPNVMIPGMLPERGNQSFPVAPTGTARRIYYTPPGSNPIAHNVYGGPVLSSSPTLSFPSSPYQYPVFPYGASFPVPSPAILGVATHMDSSSVGRHSLTSNHSLYFGHPGVLSSSYPQPYLVSIPDGKPNGGLDNNNNNRWGSLGLDLNSGPASIDVESRNDPSLFAMGQFSVANSQAFTEEQMRMFQASGVVLKRKEPDGGWDAEKSTQPSWH